MCIRDSLYIMNKADLADPDITAQWLAYFKSAGAGCLPMNSKQSGKAGAVKGPIEKELSALMERRRKKGMIGARIRVMVVGIPNVGKSTFINKVARRKAAAAGDRPGVTRGKQWITVDQGLLLLDTPGILWPKFEDPEVGMRLAYTGAVKEDVIDTETLACHFIALLAKYYPQTLSERYKLEAPEGADGYDLLQLAGKKRGYLVSGGEVNTERMAKALMDDYRSGKLGKLTLESPEDMQ